MTFTAPLTGDATSIDTLQIERFEHGGIGSVMLANFEVTPRNSKGPAFKMADLKATNLDLRRPFAAIAKPTWWPGAPLGRINVDTASASGFGGEALGRYGISLDSITTETNHEGKGISHTR